MTKVREADSVRGPVVVRLFTWKKQTTFTISTFTLFI